MENSNDTGRLIGALILGAAIGGALGILFAPDKGSETRRKIAQKSGDLTDSVKEKFMGLIDEVKKEVSSIKNKSHELVEKNGAMNS